MPASSLVVKNSSTHTTLIKMGWKEDIAGSRTGTVWMNSPPQFTAQLSYEGERDSLLEKRLSGLFTGWEVAEDGRHVGTYRFEIMATSAQQEKLDAFRDALSDIFSFHSCVLPPSLLLEIFDVEEQMFVFRERFTETANQ